MKRIIITIAFLSLAFAAGAQDMYYAETLSRNNYYGTARSIALGNAVTALGGDLGTVGINPAGSAVSNFSQFTFTPGMVFSTTGTSFSPDGSDSKYGLQNDLTHRKFTIPNCGLNSVILTGHDWGLKAISFGFILNSTENYLNYSTGVGRNSVNSMAGNMAAGAQGIAPNDMGGCLYAGYNGGLFGRYGLGNNYVGCNEGLSHNIPGELNQYVTTNRYGHKTDVLLNMGLNYEDKLYLGINVGVPSVKYNRYDSLSEEAVDPEQFPVFFSNSMVSTNYKSDTSTYGLNTDADGVYVKVGAIWLPFEGLRLGVALQSPTDLVINERWQYYSESNYTRTAMNGSAHSQEGEFTYELITPYVANVGAALTIPEVGLVSVDYELTDYSVMRYRDLDYDEWGGNTNNAWYGTNLANKYFCGLSHNLRIGGEIKILPSVSLRAGYSILTCPERYRTDDSGNRYYAEDFLDGNNRPVLNNVNKMKASYIKSNTTALSFGLGYSSTGSFFADFAIRATQYPVSYYNPYYYTAYSSPLEKISRSVMDAVMTFGWRF